MTNTELKDLVFRRSKGYCEYCKLHLDYSSSPFCVEHIIPVSKSGSDTQENLACSCIGCNGHKYNKTHALDEESGLWVKLFHPRTDNWQDHFSWDETYQYIIGLTPVGRVTVITLQLNRSSLIKLRQALILFGVHPPPTS